MGFERVVVHRAALASAEWTRTRTLLTEALGAPSAEDDAVAVWKVPR
jgi:hypothetical protein